MPEIVDHVNYLSQEIGARPAGTEEEQNAALYITEAFQKSADIPAMIEDFDSVTDPDFITIICCAVMLLCTVLGWIVPSLGVLWFLLLLLCAVLYCAEALDKSLLSQFVKRGVSQNVVAKYTPGQMAQKGTLRSRKVVLISRYDSGKVMPELSHSILPYLPHIQKASLVGIVLLPFLILFRSLSAVPAGGILLGLTTAVTAIGFLLAAIPLAIGVSHKISHYNAGANCNASGVAVLLDVATKVGRGRVSEQELAEREKARIHGEEAAREEGLIPEGVEFGYEVEGVKSPDMLPQTPEARLAAAKAAVAALTGKPVESAGASDISQHLVQVKEPPRTKPDEEEYLEEYEETQKSAGFRTDNPVQKISVFDTEDSDVFEVGEGSEGDIVETAFVLEEAADEDTPSFNEGESQNTDSSAASSAKTYSSESFADESVPAWYKSAQEKAKKPVDGQEKPIQRSRYATALDAAVKESAHHFAKANDVIDQRAEERISSQVDIREIKAPQTTAQLSSGLFDKEADEQLSGQITEVVYDEKFEQSADEVIRKEALAAENRASLLGKRSEEEEEERRKGHRILSEAPAFLNQEKVQAELKERTGQSARTSDRVDVTDAIVGSTGRIDLEASGSQQGQDYINTMNTSPLEAIGDISESYKTKVLEPIVLPDVATLPTVSAVETTKQRAPLAEVGSEGKAAAKGLLNMLPSIDLSAQAGEGAVFGNQVAKPSNKVNESEESSSTALDAGVLRATLPSLSGTITNQNEADSQNGSVSSAGSFVSAGATGAFAPVGDELVENVAPEEIYVDDADDSEYDENFTETGAFAGPGYVEMPRSRFTRVFDRFRRKDKNAQAEQSANEWLDVDENFDARTAGKERGGWESFRDTKQPHEVENRDESFAVDSVSAEDMSDNTMAFPAVNVFAEGAYEDINNQQGEEDVVDEDGFVAVEYNQGVLPGFSNDVSDIEYYDEDDSWDEAEPEFDDVRGRYWNGGAFSTRRMEHVDMDSQALAEEVDRAAQPEVEISEELQQIYQFRNPDVNTEVWFVALGSEMVQHGGMSSFLAKHKADLRGAIIIDLDALGAGELTLVEEEGYLRTVKTSSRMQRYLKKAQQATGLSYQSSSIKWGDSSASYAIKHGCQAMHLVGMEGLKPAYLGEEEDVAENVFPDLLEARSEFVMELLKNI